MWGKASQEGLPRQESESWKVGSLVQPRVATSKSFGHPLPSADLPVALSRPAAGAHARVMEGPCAQPSLALA